jgi:preprotein translocase subunit SecG
VNTIFFISKIIHYSVCIGLVLIVLLQTGKNGGMMGIFGSGESNKFFNAHSGEAFMKKSTTVMACIFLITSIMLTKISASIELISVTEKTFSNSTKSVHN